MATTTFASPSLVQLRHNVTEVRATWPWFVGLGVLLILCGFVALDSVVAASLATAVVIGTLLLIGGVFDVVGAFWARAWSGVFEHMLSGVLSIVVGLLFVRAPVGALLALTMLLACLLMVGGIFKIAAAVSYRFAAWGWPVVGGAIDVVLGVMIWRQWPASALWVIGLFLGINLIFRGLNWIGLGLALRAARRVVVEATAAERVGERQSPMPTKRTDG